MRNAGVGRVLIANQVVVAGEIDWLAAATADGFQVYCYVDSLAGVDIIESQLTTTGSSASLPVFVELGIAGGRTGARSVAAALTVAEAAHQSSHLTLAGVSGFEGILGPIGGRSAAGVVTDFLDQIVELAEAIDARGWFGSTSETILTAGGSSYFDHVLDRFQRAQISGPKRIVLRSGCYITHDDGAIHAASPMGEVPRTGHDEHLHPALKVWGVVLSRPEPTRAIVGIGKRDASTDGLFPLVKKVRRRGSYQVELVDQHRVVAVNDQHSFLDLDAADPLAVGDLVGFGISHPCTTFDKWRAIPIVSDDYTVLEIAETMF